MDKILKPIKACLAIILTLPAIYLPFRLQNAYKRVISLITYKLKDFKFITNLLIKNSGDEEKHDE